MTAPSEPLALALRAGRETFNAQFAAARQRYPDLDGPAFSAFLVSVIEPWVVATAQARPENVSAVVQAGYALALELVGQRLVGPAARHVEIERGLGRVMPAVARIAALAPGKVLGAVSNALHALAQTPGARPTQWIDALERLGPRCADVDALLVLGQLSAWRAGLAHFRKGALTAADQLPASLALAAVGAGEDVNWGAVRARLEADPWFDPGGPERGLQVVAAVGSFRGFGGLFLEPPRVLAHASSLLVQSAGEAWLLIADAFGATLHPASASEVASASREAVLPAGLRVDETSLTHGGVTLPLPTRGAITSSACAGSTLALTSALTHAVILVALP
jgi:hypothetical protein